MSKKDLIIDDKALLARIDLLGTATADTAKFAEGNDKVVLALNQAIIALEDAFRILNGGR